MNEFTLKKKEYVELKNLLKLNGLCNSGGEAMTAIAEGRVMVDNNVELRKRCKIRAGQIVEFEGQTIIVKSDKVNAEPVRIIMKTMLGKQ